VWKDRHGEVHRGILALLVAKMIKIEFLYGIAMDIHAKGARLSEPWRFSSLHQLLQSQICFCGDMRFHHGLVFALCCQPHFSVIILPLEGNIIGCNDCFHCKLGKVQKGQNAIIGGMRNKKQLSKLA
jgi:hypothetical protein